MRVLLVEDDPDLSRQLKSALADAGYAVDHAPDGEEAHFLGDTEPYDAVILDLGLPKIDGVSVLERWRRTTSLRLQRGRSSSRALRSRSCRYCAGEKPGIGCAASAATGAAVAIRAARRTRRRFMDGRVRPRALNGD